MPTKCYINRLMLQQKPRSKNVRTFLHARTACHSAPRMSSVLLTGEEGCMFLYPEWVNLKYLRSWQDLACISSLSVAFPVHTASFSKWSKLFLRAKVTLCLSIWWLIIWSAEQERNYARGKVYTAPESRVLYQQKGTKKIYTLQNSLTCYTCQLKL